MTEGARSPGVNVMHSATSPAIGDVVRMAEGNASRSTEPTRSSLAPPSGADSGTAI